MKTKIQHLRTWLNNNFSFLVLGSSRLNILILIFICSTYEGIGQKLTEGNTYALIVGIADYQNPNIKDLEFADRDATLFRDYLASKAGQSVPPKNIKLLTGINATISNIYTTKDWLVEQAKPGDMIYFYFSGHGDTDNERYKIGYLLAYDTPFESYQNNAVRIEDFNNMANTLSIEKNIRVVLITDACHSGKLSKGDNRGISLTGNDSEKAKENEIRIASCEPKEKSFEDDKWGGGRGAFSYYLINGLKGMADQGGDDSDGVVTVEELDDYLGFTVKKAVKKIKNAPQHPVIEGERDQIIAIVDDPTLEKVKTALASNGSITEEINSEGIKSVELSEEDFDLYFRSFDENNLKNTNDFHILNEMNDNEIVDYFISKKIYFSSETFDSFYIQLDTDPNLRKYYKRKLAASIHNDVQKAINGYISGDKAETDKRQYYYYSNSDFGEYGIMLETAMKLVDSSTYFYEMMNVKRHYFNGVNAKLDMYYGKSTDSLYKIALFEQQTALALDPRAGYILNELGDLAYYKGETKKALDYYNQALELSPNWAIALANISKVYYKLGEFQKCIEIATQTIKAKPQYDLGYYFLGLAAFEIGNYLIAEENLLKTIRKNDNHFLPFEKLGMLYTFIGEYDKANRFFAAAELRKNQKLEIHDYTTSFGMSGPGTYDTAYELDEMDTSMFGPNDIMAYVVFGYQNLKNRNYELAETLFRKAVEIDDKNPILYRYLSELMFNQKKWMESELYFDLAYKYYLDENSFKKHAKALKKKQKYLEFEIYEKYKRLHFKKQEIDFFLANIHQKWGYPYKAIDTYKSLVEYHNIDLLLSTMKIHEIYNEIGLYHKAEEILLEFEKSNRTMGRTQLKNHYIDLANEGIDLGINYYKAGKLIYNMYFEHMDTSYFDNMKEIEIPGTEEIVQIQGWIFYTDYNQKLYLLTQGADYLEKASENVISSSLKSDCFKMAGDIYDKLAFDSKNLEYEEISETYYQLASDLYALPGHKERLINTSMANSNFSNAHKELKILARDSTINFQHLTRLAEYKIKSGDFSKGQELLSEIQNIYPTISSRIRALTALMYLLNGENKKALNHYKDLIKFNDLHTPQILYTIARIYALESNFELGISYLQKAIDNGFNNNWVIDKDPNLENLRHIYEWPEIRNQLPPSVVKSKEREFDLSSYMLSIE